MSARRRRSAGGGAGPAAPASLAFLTRLHDFGESSAVAVLITEDLGAVHALAKGAKRLKNSFQGPLDKGVLYRVRMGRRASQGLYHLHSSRVQEPFARLRLEPGRFLAAALVLEVAGDLMRESEPHRELFRLASFTLKALDRAPRERIALAVTLFLARAVALSGHEPATQQCVACGGSTEETARPLMSFTRGGVLHARCAAQEAAARPIARELLALLHDMVELPAADILASTSRAPLLMSLRRFLVAWLEHTLERAFRAFGPMERELGALGG